MPVHKLFHFFVKFFNTLFDKGIFPENWTESLILPLFKKGDINNPGFPCVILVVKFTGQL